MQLLNILLIFLFPFINCLHNTAFLCFIFTNSFESSSPSDQPKFNPFNPLNLFSAHGPGIYEIRCKTNGKRYIGEASNVLDQLGKHTRSLNQGVSKSSKLQLDWKPFGASNFEAFVLFIGPEWA